MTMTSTQSCGLHPGFWGSIWVGGGENELLSEDDDDDAEQSDADANLKMLSGQASSPSVTIDHIARKPVN